MEYLEIKGMKFHSYIGHFDEEKEIGNKFDVSIRLGIDYLKAAETDKLKNAVDYVSVYNLIKAEMKKKCNLVENVAFRIKAVIFENFPQVQSIYLKIAKLSPKIGGIVDEMSIIIDEDRLNKKSKVNKTSKNR